MSSSENDFEARRERRFRIAARLGALDGLLEVTSGAGAGTSVTGTVPTSPLVPEAEEEVLTS